MPVRGLPTRLLRWLSILCGGGLALVGGLGLEPAGRVAVAVAGVLAACVAVGCVRDVPLRDRRSAIESAVLAAGWTVGVLLTLAGVAALTGGVVAALAGVAGVATWLVVRALRAPDRPGPRAVGAPSRSGDDADAPLSPVSTQIPASGPGGGSVGLPALSTPALGREWIGTTRALGERPGPVERQALVRRRVELLDELERRDPAGFARWLADGPEPGSDPADYVRRRPVQGDAATETDAA